MTARTSRAESTRYSSPAYLTSVPPYLEYSTVSPTATSSGTRLPLSSMRPGPTARTVPSCGFSFAVSGITMPDAVVVSASFAWTRIRSSSGLIATLVAVVTGIPSWGTGVVAGQSSDRRQSASCHRAGPSSRVPVRLAQPGGPGWHPRDESANREVMPRLALRQPECQHDAVLRTPSGDAALAAAAALTQVALRRKAAAKFGADADRMFFTRAGLEQATRRVVADLRAARLA